MYFVIKGCFCVCVYNTNLYCLLDLPFRGKSDGCLYHKPSMAINGKESVKMLSVGKKVLYGTNGVCSVDDITVKRIGRVDIEYFVLKPVCSNTSTLFVPSKNTALLSKIRDVSSPEKLKKIIENPPEAGEWIDNKIERSESFKEIIASADCERLVALIRLILSHEKEQHSKGKHLHISDEKILKEAEKMVTEEFSVVLGVEPDKVISMLV